MNFFKRFFFSILRIVSIIAFLIGAILIIMHFTGEPGMLVPGIILAVVGGICASSFAKKRDSSKRASIQKCKGCGGSLANGAICWEVDGKPYVDGGLDKIPVKIEITCPNCGKVKILTPSVYYDKYKIESSIKKNVEEYIHDYIR